MRRLIYVIGAPGSGKTTLVHGLLDGKSYRLEKEPFAHRCFANNLIVFGDDREDFGGTDGLRRDVLPIAVRWLRDQPDGLTVLGEGDRLGQHKFFLAARRLGYSVDVFVLATSEMQQHRQLSKRKRIANGKRLPDPSSAWLKGRSTHIARLAERWCPIDHWLDGDLPYSWNVKYLRSHVAFQGVL